MVTRPRSWQESRGGDGTPSPVKSVSSYKKEEGAKRVRRVVVDRVLDDRAVGRHGGECRQQRRRRRMQSSEMRRSSDLEAWAAISVKQTAGKVRLVNLQYWV
ncbi:hypothetical protein L2E82_38818 [Cichorium intybus]|uniref:Uncharacterized protein n=1 Tax=Cichorium intybus TaxID=13427 RepID=A0ACB9AH97_CICIN|nr:hypothetical protein L2E82_38818 [Cichorium intybus]